MRFKVCGIGFGQVCPIWGCDNLSNYATGLRTPDQAAFQSYKVLRAPHCNLSRKVEAKPYEALHKPFKTVKK